MMNSIFNLDHYFFNLYALPHFLVGVFISVEGLYVFAQSKKSIIHASYLITTLTAGIWLTGVGLGSFSSNEQTSWIWYLYVSWFGIIFITPAVYLFSASWDSDLLRKRKKLIFFNYLCASAFYLICLSSTYLVEGLWHYPTGYFPKAGPLEMVFIAWFYALMILSFVNFMRIHRTESAAIQKKNKKLMFIAFAVAFIGSVEYLPNYGVHVFPVAFLPMFLFTTIIGYCVIRYKLMDIETVIHKTIMWTVLSSIVLLPFGMTLYFLRDLLVSLHPFLAVSSVLALFLVFMIYAKTVQPWIDHLFQRRKHDLEKTLLKFNDNLVYLKGLNDLAYYITQTIRDVLYVDKVQILIKRNDDLSTIGSGGDGVKTIPFRGNAFMKWLEENDEIAFSEFVELDPKYQPVVAQAKEHFCNLDAKVSVPLVLDRTLIGLIHLGKKANLKSFSGSEAVFLSELRRAATIALSNSLRLIEMQESLRKWNEELEAKVLERTEQLKEAQKQLIQAEKLATIGVLAGGVAHEINNPLTAVLTNAQILKMGASKDDLESIQLIEAGAKRCQEIIQKIMKYARKPLGPEKTEVVNLNDVVGNVIAFLKYQIEQENIEMVAQKNGDISLIEGNSNELEQVLTNLVLNAKDAVKDVNRPGKIEIKTLTCNGTVGFVVSDNGHGIAPDNLSKIFDPFFTTKDIGKGTGMGLAVTYGIVKKYNGNIDVSSKVGEGTTFMVTFPKMTR